MSVHQGTWTSMHRGDQIVDGFMTVEMSILQLSNLLYTTFQPAQQL